MSTPAETLEWLLRPAANNSGLDRKALAGLLVELARNVEPELYASGTGIDPVDPRLHQLRRLLLGREIDLLARLSELVEDPEQLAVAMSRALPTAIAHASKDDRLGLVLTPALEKATESSIRANPRTLVNILYPLIVPAIRKSIGETIDETFQSLNEALKHSLSLRGLKWRLEAWRTGSSFAEVVLRHTLVYQVEHVFLIHRHTGLLMCHIAAENAASQDPQLVASMLGAIQDFVRDSFTGAEEQGLDTLRLGELRLWSEAGPFATLVAVIRGNPPEGLHDILRTVLTRIHAERPQALENFDGDSTGFGDIEARLTECVTLRQVAPMAERDGFPWLVALGASLAMLIVCLWGFHWWQTEHRWDSYIARLRAQPGIIVTEIGSEHGKRLVAGLRDPLAADPVQIARDARIDPAKIVFHWEPYQGLDTAFVLKRLVASLDPPPTVTLAVEGNHIVAQGSAGLTWLQRARAVARVMPAGSPDLDLSGVRNFNEGAIAKLRGAIESHEILFDNNESLPAAGQDKALDQAAHELNELAALSATLRVTTRVTLVGHSDAAGKGTFNLFLSVARAEAVLALLKKRGVDPQYLAVRGAGPLEPRQTENSDAARSANRWVSFTVGIEE